MVSLAFTDTCDSPCGPCLVDRVYYFRVSCLVLFCQSIEKTAAPFFLINKHVKVVVRNS